MAILYIPILMFIASLAHGYALMVLWKWFAVPIFHLPVLSIPQALGVGMLIGLLTQDGQNSSDNEAKSLLEICINGTVRVLIRSAFALLFGWVVLQFV